MFQTCPEIHGNRSDLNLNLCINRPVSQIYGNRHHHVIALIAIGLGILNVIFYIEHRNIALFRNHLSNLINI